MAYWMTSAGGGDEPPYGHPTRPLYSFPGLNTNTIYSSTLKFVLLFFSPDLQKSCIDFITIRPDDEPCIADVIEVLSVLQKGCAPLHILATKYYSMPILSFDFHRLIIFCQLNGLIKPKGSDFLN